MDFDWNNPPFNLNRSLNVQSIEESFEDPFAVRLLPDSPRFSVQARYFNLGMTGDGTGIFSLYRTNGKQVKVIYARPFEPEEQNFYQRKLNQTLAS
ncbi:MAG: ribonuclease toxin brnt of type ii toxin-antitoxin system [Verrucomicrobiales bacterium]|nr:ribonuclease toxin brnt of type ii toxin-antitoxin system [Verrucomicrobiales bacterium]